MTDRGRLIALINQKQNGGWRFVTGEYTTDTTNEELADHLLANDVVIPVQCKNCYRCIPYDNVLYCTYFNRNVNEDDYCSHGG